MKIIIPMAGRGSRLRPHTLTVPKPLVPIAGKPIVQRLVEDLVKNLPEKVDEIAYIIGDFGEEVEKQLLEIAENQDAKGSIYYQNEPLGPAHAIHCASKSIHGKCIVAFSDTLFRAKFQFDPEQDGVIWTQKVSDPSSFGVVTADEHNMITGFVEKPSTPVSDLAIVGIYYFNDGERLCAELDTLIKNDIREKGEFQITTVLERMRGDGVRFAVDTVDEWMDCGNKEAILQTNKRILDQEPMQNLEDVSVTIINSTIIPPCHIGNGVIIKNSVVGPYVSIGDDCVLKQTVLKDTVIQKTSEIQYAVFENSMIGNNAYYKGTPKKVSLGDFSQMSD
ncbi:MAG: NTP transferase domain-containing protein [Bacteroidetes bacterium]|jgi:glucose-1-phosphate thymidylyltransferase|nr:NTP transferase domain-containing protein [Bacteroidota bacterium]